MVDGCDHDHELAGGAVVGEALCHWVAGPGIGCWGGSVGGGVVPGIGGAETVGG